MAMFYQDSELTCSKCGGKVLFKRTAAIYTQHPKIKNAYTEEIVRTELVCCKCGNVVKTFKSHEKTVFKPED